MTLWQESRGKRARATFEHPRPEIKRTRRRSPTTTTTQKASEVRLKVDPAVRKFLARTCVDKVPCDQVRKIRSSKQLIGSDEILRLRRERIENRQAPGYRRWCVKYRGWREEIIDQKESVRKWCRMDHIKGKERTRTDVDRKASAMFTCCSRAVSKYTRIRSSNQDERLRAR